MVIDSFYHLLNKTIMRSIFYIIAVVLLVGWLLGAFVYTAGSIIHFLLVLAIVSVVLGAMRRDRVIP